MPWRCTGSEGVRGVGAAGEDGRRVGDTGCDEAADLICSPSPSPPASVTRVSSPISALCFSSLHVLLTRASFSPPLYFSELPSGQMCTLSISLHTVDFVISFVPSPHPSLSHFLSLSFTLSSFSCSLSLSIWCLVCSVFPTLPD